MRHDAFALGGTDRVVALGAELDAINSLVQIEPGVDVDVLSVRAVAIEDRIAAAVPTSTAGGVVQMKLLRQLARDFEWGEGLEEIAANLIAGLEQLAEQSPVP